MVLEFPAFVLFGVYSPANSNGLRDNFRFGFLTALDARIRNLIDMGKRVVLTGDLNVSREELDTAKAEESMRQEGITREDYLNAPNRRIFNQLLEHGRVPGTRDPGREYPVLWDLCREFHPEREGMFTHWEQKINARPGNFGSRIDYVLCSINIKSWFVDANIQEGLMGSDHCPVYASTKDIVDVEGEQVHISDLMNSSGTFKAGFRLRDYHPSQDILPLSGRLLPEFDKRRSIKDMLSKVTAPVQAPSVPSHSPLKAQSQETDLSGSTVAPHVPHTSNSSRAGQKLTLSSPEKRRSSGAALSSIAKKSRTSVATSSKPLSSSTKGQQSLRGYLVHKADPLPGIKLDGASHSAALTMEPLENMCADVDNVEDSIFEPGSIRKLPQDPEASRLSWVKLFSKKPLPRCEGHNEPCTSLTTKKPGINCGRQFWICSR